MIKVLWTHDNLIVDAYEGSTIDLLKYLKEKNLSRFFISHLTADAEDAAKIRYLFTRTTSVGSSLTIPFSVKDTQYWFGDMAKTIVTALLD